MVAKLRGGVVTKAWPASTSTSSDIRLDYRKSTLARGSRCHYVTANGVRNGLHPAGLNDTHKGVTISGIFTSTGSRGTPEGALIGLCVWEANHRWGPPLEIMLFPVHRPGEHLSADYVFYFPHIFKIFFQYFHIISIQVKTV